ncbi:MAG: YicC/YloC family endoribonuclease [Pseudomonadota bacterium]
MIRSMTGFARSETRTEWGTLVWELRTVNHRYRETSLRLPEEFRASEARIREIVAAAVRRGKLECSLRFKAKVGGTAAIELNRELLEQLVRAGADVATALDGPGAPNPMDYLRWPGVVTEPELDTAPLRLAALELLEEALGQLDETRRSEGGRIETMLLSRCDAIVEAVAGVRERLPAVQSALRDRLTARLGELDLEVEPARLEQEFVIHAHKMDVAEELDRLDSHVAEARKALAKAEPVGRRLDFLMQEFNREANTLASKSQDAETSRVAVDLKVLIEQMREQVQNVE